MEQNANSPLRTSTGEQALPPIPAIASAETPDFGSAAEEYAYWAGVRRGLASVDAANAEGEAMTETGPEARRLRADGWLPWKKARFLEEIAAGSAVADACRAVGMSVASAYALRSRPSGRAFGAMWESLTVHRARTRLADNNMSRAMDGWVEQIVRNGEVVAERRRFDNRLSMAMLTRLDRLAAAESGEEADLSRALSEDFEEYLELIEKGGDEDAFVEARRPAELEPVERRKPWYRRDQLDDIAAAAGTSAWRHVPPPDIPLDDLDPDRMAGWELDGWIRAIRSHYLTWIELHRDSGEPLPDGPDCPAAYNRVRRDIMAELTANAVQEEAGESLESSPDCPGSDEDPRQPSTSSTSPIDRPRSGETGGES